MLSTRRLVAAAFVIASLVATAPAAAHQSPAGCGTSGVNVQFTGNDVNIIHRNGDAISVGAKIRNDAPNVCDVTDATVKVIFPKADGTAGGEAETKVIATGVDLPAGTPPTDLPAVQGTVDFNPGVFRGPIKIRTEGTFHWIGTHSSGHMGTLERPLAVTHPHATITVTPTPAMGDAPLGVTYSYAVTNDSPHDPNPGAVDPNIHAITLTDDRCSPIPSTHTGDTNMNNVMEPGETWTYTCTTPTPFPGGTFTNNVSMSATSTRDGRPWPATIGQSTVTVNGPDMTLAKSHTGDFRQGDTGRTYSLVARNSGNRASTGSVEVVDALPPGLTATGISGEGWTCDGAALSCRRNDSLAAGEAYPPITVTVDVAANAPATVTNTATVTRAGENTENDGASDPTTIGPPAPPPPPDPGQENPGGGSNGDQPGAGAGDQPGEGQREPRTGGDVSPRDVTAPAFSALRMTNRTFAVDTRRAVRGAREPRPKKGTVFVYTLSEAARVVFTVERKTVGRRAGGKCVRATKRNRRARRCVRFVRAGTFTQDGAAGPNSKRWLGTVASRPLPPGVYRSQVVATDAAGNTSVARRLSFRIVGR